MKKIVFYSLIHADDSDLYNLELPKVILDHVQKYHFSNDTRRSIVAYNRVKSLLKEFGNCSIDDLFFEKHGKPSLPKGYISISHSENLVAVAYSDYPIGIDIERIGNASRGIYSKIFKKEEIEKMTNDDFYMRWTYLEAKAKLNNTNIFDLENNEGLYSFTSIIDDEEMRYAFSIVTKEDSMEMILK